jgi:alpha-beta hydrolase superfamily lysophospholipase
MCEYCIPSYPAVNFLDAGMIPSMQKQELILVNRDGKRMPSTLQIPEGAAKGTVIVLHGLGGLRDQSLIKAVAHGMTEEGYVSLTFDDSHAVKSLDARFFEATTSQYLRDVEDAVDYAQKQNWFTAPLILAGHSMGGFVAVHHTRLHQDAARLILLAPAMSWKTMWGAAVPFLVLWLITGTQKFLSIDEKHHQLGRAWILDFLKYDAHKDARFIDVPTLILSAENDETVARPPEHAKFAAHFSHADHRTIAHADHDFDGHEDAVVATITSWLTSS